MFKVILIFIRYVFLGLGFLLSPILGLFYFFCAIGSFLGSEYCLRQWYVVDVAIASMIYNTHWRTISGYTGEMAYKTKKPFWVRQEKFIDFLAKLVGDGDNHCYRAYLWEKKSISHVN